MTSVPIPEMKKTELAKQFQNTPKVQALDTIHIDPGTSKSVQVGSLVFPRRIRLQDVSAFDFQRGRI